MNESVTSVSKRETKLADAAAAITVITPEDIRRTGVSSIPEALRMVPGLDVARISANEWAIGARGFNLQYAAKLLVLVDGRSVYTPTSAGVYWNDQDLVLEDLARIEVIRGPGATLWGANAVNGVINIITKRANETQGLLLSTSYGTEERPSASIRYGGQLTSNLFYRAYVKYFDRAGFVDSTGKDTADEWSMARGGLRFDWEPTSHDGFTLQGDYYSGEVGQAWQRTSLAPPYGEPINLRNDNDGGNILSRWTHHYSDTSSSTLQLYYDHFRHGDAGITERRENYDFDWQHRFEVAERQTITWGLGYRHTKDRLPSIFYLTYVPERRSQSLYTAFAQDEITLAEDRVTLTLGSKFEDNDYTGFEIQPNARLLWRPTANQSLWAAVSRAVRTPSRFERDSRFNTYVSPPVPPDPPGIVAIIGNQHLVAEEIIAYELGYRIDPLASLSLDAAAFYNVYDNLIGIAEGPLFTESDPPPDHTVIPYFIQNNGQGETYGVELSARWKVTESWRLIAGYTWLHMRLQPDDFYLSSGDSPQNQFHFRSYLNLPGNLQLNGALYYVDNLPNQKAPAYVRLDAGLVWNATESLELGVWGQNLLDNQHFEFGSYNTPIRTEIPRSVFGKISWRF